MNTITCPGCGNEASAFGTVTNCWCDKMYCDHTRDMFASFSCACGCSGETPQAKQHREHQYAKFQAEMAADVGAVIARLEEKIRQTFQLQSISCSDSDVHAIFSSGRSAVITVSGVYATPKEFQVASEGQTVTVKGGSELKALLDSLASVASA